MSTSISIFTDSSHEIEESFISRFSVPKLVITIGDLTLFMGDPEWTRKLAAALTQGADDLEAAQHAQALKGIPSDV